MLRYCCYFMMIITYSAFLLIISAVCVRTNPEHGDVFIRCERYEGSNRNMTFSCNLTNHMQSIPSCPPQSFYLPVFNRIKIECDSEMSFLSHKAGCRIFDLDNDEKEIFHANGTLFEVAMEASEDMRDGLLTFESIFSNVVSLGKAFVRCRSQRPNDHALTCSLFGVSDKYFTTGNLSCSLTSHSQDERTLKTDVFQCGFSEDHESGKNRGNVTVSFKMFKPDRKFDVDMVLVARFNNNPWNIFENLRLGCQVTNLNDNTLQIIECGAYLNENRFCEDPECCKKKKSLETDEIPSEGNQIRDRVWELDRTIDVDIEHTGLGRTKFTCNIARDVRTLIMKCPIQFCNGDDVYFEDMSLIDVTIQRSTLLINRFDKIRLNIDNLVSFRGLLIEKCQVHMNNFTVSCEFQLGNIEQLKGSLHCDMQMSLYQNMTYPIACTFSLPNEQTIFEGQLSNLRGDTEDTTVTLTGQFKSMNRPEVTKNVSVSCDLMADYFVHSNISQSALSCKVDSFINKENLCEVFQGLCVSGVQIP